MLLADSALGEVSLVVERLDHADFFWIQRQPLMHPPYLLRARVGQRAELETLQKDQPTFLGFPYYVREAMLQECKSMRRDGFGDRNHFVAAMRMRSLRRALGAPRESPSPRPNLPVPVAQLVPVDEQAAELELCAVCLEPCDGPAGRVRTGCGHFFHAHCLNRWRCQIRRRREELSEPLTCPVCRASLNSKTYELASLRPEARDEEPQLAARSADELSRLQAAQQACQAVTPHSICLHPSIAVVLATQPAPLVICHIEPARQVYAFNLAYGVPARYGRVDGQFGSHNFTTSRREAYLADMSAQTWSGLGPF